MAKIVQLRDRETTEKQYPVTVPQAVVDEAGRNVLEIIETYFKDMYTEEDVMYGVEWDVTVANTAMTRIGNTALHRQLPIQNRMKGCLLDDDGNVVEYLNPTSWEGHTLDGSKGQVMVEIPMHYRKFETDGNTRRAKISEYPLPGYHVVPKMYISAYEATVQRSTLKLCSVKNSDADYRGGTNDATRDGAYNSLLGRPATKISRTNFRTYARTRKPATTEWNILDYNCYKAVFWLYYIEYANRNCQLAFNAEKDANGYAQGGLGTGVNVFYDDQSPSVPCGHTDALGNGTGEVAYEMLQEDGTIKATVYANRYRGIENPFGHIMKWVDGINVLLSKTAANGGEDTSKVYVADAPANYNDSNYDGYTMRGLASRSNGYAKDIIFGEFGDIIAVASGGSNTSYWTDYYYSNFNGEGIVGMQTLTEAMGTKASGFCGMRFDAIPTSTYAQYGTRLCFIPKNQ